MTRRSPIQVLADVNAALVDQQDITDILSRLLQDAATALDADAAGLLVTNRSGELELLSATSHHIAVLEVLQAQHRGGPCMDCMRTRESVSAEGAESIRHRWPEIGPAIVAADFQMIHAQPLRWHDGVLGGLNFFRTRPQPFTADQAEFAGAITDAAMLALTRSPGLDLDGVIGRIQTALHGRILVEQAKGVLAHRHRLDMAGAYQRLLSLADRDGKSLTVAAERVIGQSVSPADDR